MLISAIFFGLTQLAPMKNPANLHFSIGKTNIACDAVLH